MSDLQISLIALGAVAVLGIFGYNKWQERKERRFAETVFRSEHADVLLEPQPAPQAAAERVEPVFTDGERMAPTGVPVVPVEPVGMSPAPTAAGEIPTLLADPKVDCIARIEVAELAPAQALWEAHKAHFMTLEERVRILGWSDSHARWEQVTANGAGSYRQLAAALQLADRRGAISANGLQVYLNGLRQLADRFLGIADLPDRATVLARAADLDRFCAAVDVQIGINLLASDGAGFSGTKLRGMAEAAGFQLGEDGAFHFVDDRGHTLFTLANLEPALFAGDEMKSLVTHGLTLSLDVPRVADGGGAFDRMIVSARQLAQGLDAKLVDDNRAPLSDAALKMIRAKILEFQRAMLSRGTAAGSAPALRLFN